AVLASGVAAMVRAHASSSTAVDARTADSGGTLAISGVNALDDQRAQQPASAEPHAFRFTRGAYSSFGRGWGRRGGSWATDYPKADLQFLTVLRRLTNID